MEGPYLFVRGKLCILKSRFIAMHKVDFGRDDDQFRIYWDGGEALLSVDEARIIENQLLGVVAQPHPIPHKACKEFQPFRQWICLARKLKSFFFGVEKSPVTK